ncbi:PRC-barrel domain containing protein [Candidatus Woesearchaeota archaeon]|nr:MAG: PRC-barrel domain containing protein [Candidatus Woesearchaeota archaeon]
MPANETTSDDILGRQAVAPDGAVLGTVVKLHIDRDKKEILGITIDQGLAKPYLFIGREFIRKFGVDAVFLSQIPKETFKGLEVFTEEGRLVGRVKEVITENNLPKSIVVEVSKGLFKKDELVVPVTKIAELGQRVIIKKNAL